MKSIVVFCASQSQIDKKYFELAYDTGRAIAQAGYTLINGGGAMGLMGASIDGCLEAGGEAIGIIPEFMDALGWAHKGLSRKIMTPDMSTRKAQMVEMSQGCITLPGGIGTLDELTEIMTLRQLKIYNHPVVLLNYQGFYDAFLGFMNQMGEEKFLRNDMELCHPATSASQAVEYISTH